MIRLPFLSKAFHGDVIIEPAEIPKEAVVFDANNTLAEGEVTGHAHRIVSGTVEFLKWNERTYLNVLKEAKLSHEEHKTIILPVGSYSYDIAREYDYDTEEARRVAD